MGLEGGGGGRHGLIQSGSGHALVAGSRDCDSIKCGDFLSS
jgi:hypothetical protein